MGGLPICTGIVFAFASTAFLALEEEEEEEEEEGVGVGCGEEKEEEEEEGVGWGEGDTSILATSSTMLLDAMWMRALVATLLLLETEGTVDPDDII